MFPDDPVDSPLPIIVKNTFIEIGDPTPTARRRSASTPPATFARGGAGAEEEPRDSARAAAGGKASASASTAASTPSSTPLATYRLNSRARLFQPRPGGAAPPPLLGPAAPQPPMWPQQGPNPSFSEAIGRAVLALASALAGTGEVQVAARAVESQHGWLVDVEVAPFDYMGQILEHAKATLLSIAEQSSCVYVMGYRSKPFQEKHNAFQATLGIMKDENLACWDAYSEGICYRGRGCRWQHPPVAKCLLVAARPNLGTGPSGSVLPPAAIEEQYACGGQLYY